MSEWQPIETAPKDGNVLVCGAWPETGLAWINIGSCCDIGVFGDWSSHVEPTHWMPLPEPPSA